jgi:hypothetical protein
MVTQGRVIHVYTHEARFLGPTQSHGATTPHRSTMEAMGLDTRAGAKRAHEWWPGPNLTSGSRIGSEARTGHWQVGCTYQRQSSHGGGPTRGHVGVKGAMGRMRIGRCGPIGYELFIYFFFIISSLLLFFYSFLHFLFLYFPLLLPSLNSTKVQIQKHMSQISAKNSPIMMHNLFIMYFSFLKRKKYSSQIKHTS